MSPVISERSLEEAIEQALLAEGADPPVAVTPLAGKSAIATSLDRETAP